MVCFIEGTVWIYLIILKLLVKSQEVKNVEKSKDLTVMRIYWMFLLSLTHPMVNKQHISVSMSQLGAPLFLSDSDESVEIIEPVKKAAKLQKMECISSVKADTTSGEQNSNTNKIASSSTHVTPKLHPQQSDSYAPRSSYDEEFAELDAWLQNGGVDII